MRPIRSLPRGKPSAQLPNLNLALNLNPNLNLVLVLNLPLPLNLFLSYLAVCCECCG